MMNNWKQRYSNNKRIIPIPKDFQQELRHMAEHDWVPKGGIENFSQQEREHLEDNIDRIHDVIHQWYKPYSDEADELEVGTYFSHISGENQGYNIREINHNHAHPESGKPITSVEGIKYTDD